MWTNSTDVDTTPEVLEHSDQHESTGNNGAEFADSTCRTIGLAVGADYVRFVEDSPERGSALVRGWWAKISAPNFAVLRDPPRSGLERKSIKTCKYSSGETPIELVAPGVQQADSSGSSLSGFAVPVADAYGILGAIGVYFERDRPDSSNEVSFVDSMASMLAGTLRAARRADLLSSESNTWRVLAQIGQLVSGSPRIEDAYDPVAKTIRTLLEYDALTIAFVDSDEQTRRIAYSAGAPLPERWSWAPVALAGSIDEEVLRSKVGLRVGEHNSQALIARHQEAADLYAVGFRSWLTVPLLWQSNEIGLLSVLSKRTDAYDDGELNVLDHVGENISGALANADLYRTVMRDVEERSIIAELSRTLSSSVRISEVYPQFADKLKRLIPFDRLTISLFHPNTGTVQKSVVYGAEVPGWHIGRNYPPGPLTDLVIRIGHGVIRSAGETYLEEDNSPYEDKATSLGLLSALAVPLTVHNRPVGAMCLRAYEPRAFTNRHLQLAERASAQIAGSILAFQYHTELNEQIDETELLEKFICDALTAKSIDAVLDRTFEAAVKVLRFDRMVLGLIRPGITPRLQLYARGMEVPGNNIAGKLTASDDDADGWLRNGYIPPFYGPIPDVAQLDSEHALRMGNAGLTSWMHVPLTAGHMLGYLAVQGRPRTGYAERHFRKLDRIAYLLAHAIQTMMPSSSRTLPGPLVNGVSSSRHRASTDLPVGASGSGASKPTKLLLVDDDPVYLAGLSTIIDGSNIDLVGATNWSDALAVMNVALPDVVLVYAHGDDATLSLIQREATRKSMPPFLAILTDGDGDEAIRYLKAGASGIISKNAPADQLVGAIEQVANGRSVVESHVADLMLSGDIKTVPSTNKTELEILSNITQRDRNILQGVASGQTNSEIAQNLNLAAGTVRNRLGDLYTMLGVPDRGSAVYKSMRLGIIE